MLQQNAAKFKKLELELELELKLKFCVA